MAVTAVPPPPFFLVKVSGLPHRLPFDFKTDILDRAQEFYPSFLDDRSYFAPRHDSTSSAERAWAALSFTAQDDAVKCAQWLLEEPRLTALGPPAVLVLRRLQSSAAELERMAAEQAQREDDLKRWQAKTEGLTAAQEKLTFGTAAAAQAAAENGREGNGAARKKSRIVDLEDSTSGSVSSGDALLRAPPQSGIDDWATSAPDKPQPQRVVLQTTRTTGGSPLVKKTAASKKAPAPSTAKTAAAKKTAKKAPDRAPVKRAPAPAPAPPAPVDAHKQKTARNMLFEALAAEMSDIEAERSEVMRQELSNGIVAALLELNPGNKFSDKVRQLIQNLKINTALRASVLEGATSPAELVGKDTAELATVELAEKVKRLEEKPMKAVTLGEGLAADAWHSTEAAVAARRRLVSGGPRAASAELSPAVQPSGTTKSSMKSTGALREEGWYEKLDLPEAAAAKAAAEGAMTKRKATEAADDRPAKAVRFSSELQPSPEKAKLPKAAAGARPKSALHAPSTAPQPASCVPPAWGPPVAHPTGAWNHSDVLTAGHTILSGGTLVWGTTGAAGNSTTARSVHAVGLRPAIDAPGVALTLPHELHVREGLTVAAMEAELRETGVQPWQCHRFWLTGPKMPGSSHAKDAPGGAPIMGRLIVTSQGHILRSLDEAWVEAAAGGPPRRGWMIFIAPPTPGVVTAAGVPLTEVDAAHRARALLGLALPLYFGKLLPRGRREAASIAVWAAGPGALHLGPSILNCTHQTRRTHIPNLDTDWRKCFGEGGEEVRLRPRPPPPGSSARSLDEVAMAALENDLRRDERALITQDGVPPHADLAVAAPRAGPGGGSRGFLLLGAWSRDDGPKGEKTILNIKKYGWPALR